MSTNINTIFSKAAKAGASDVHIVVGVPIQFRVDGELVSQGKSAVTAAQAERAIKTVLGQAKFKEFKEKKEMDTSHGVTGGVRLRVNCHYERGNPGLAARVIPKKIPSLEDVGLTDIAHLCDLEDGLILFTGPTGVGKSTSLASMIQNISDQHGGNIITLEDPIEFLFTTKNGIIRQRQYGNDFHAFPDALKHVLRQDPDIIMVGEMRDLETIAAALTLAETGHLVFATLHTPNAVQTVSRIVDVFPPHQQQQIRIQLSMSLRAIVAQRLLPCEKGGRVAHREVLVNNSAVGNIIRENRIPELKSVLQTGRDEGMCTFEKHAKELYKEGKISKETLQWAREMES